MEPSQNLKNTDKINFFLYQKRKDEGCICQIKQTKNIT